MSPQIEAILGFTPEEWCADPGLWASRLHPDDAERVLAPGAGLRRRRLTLTSPVEYRLLHRDGHAVWVRDDAVMREGPDGVRRWHGVMSDITEQKDAEAELELRAAQQAAVARLGEHALEGASLADLMQEAVSAGVELLGLEIGAVVELVPPRMRSPSAPCTASPECASTTEPRPGWDRNRATPCSAAARRW